MHSSRAVKKMKQYLKSYVTCNGRICNELQQFTLLFKNHDIINQFSSLIIKKMSAVAALKMLILLHRMIIENVITSPIVFQVTNKMSIIVNDDFDIFLEKKILTSYKLYIQKRSIIDPPATEKIQTQNEDKVYQLLNLINLGTSFTHLIYIMGRYYAEKYKFIIDFNITLAIDIKNLYNEMMDNIRRPSTFQMLYQIEIVHEHMYLVYYNCYFYNYVKNLAPKWVFTDLTLGTPPKKISENRTIIQIEQPSSLKDQLSTGTPKKLIPSSSSSGSHQSTNNQNKLSTDQIEVQISMFEDCTSIKDECQEQKSRMQLILSMQRVVSSFSEQ